VAPLDQGHLDAGVGVAQTGERVRDQRGGGAWERGQPHPPGAQAGDRRDLLFGGVEPGEDRVGVGDQGASGVGERDPAPGPGHQGGAGLLLKAADVVADRGLRVVERPSGRGHRPSCRHLAQHLEPADVKHRTPDP
jgi:hypothetical protein